MKFFSILKPGIIFGNLVTICGGVFLATQGSLNLGLLLAALLSMTLIIGSGCVINNYIDRDIDYLMERTKNRVLVQQLLSVQTAIIYAISLGITGFLLLFFTTNLLTVAIAAIGVFFYVVLYSLYFKRKSNYGTLIGAISGAVPPVIGYCAVTGYFDSAAFCVFLLLFLWQIPHFYAIALYRLSDYEAASLPVLPLRKGIPYTKKSILYYIAAFTGAAVLPSVLGYTGWVYGIVAFCFGLAWFLLGLQGLKTTEDRAWARKMFLFSIITITVLSMTMWVKV